VDHHTSWFSFLPGYQSLLDLLNGHYSNQVYFPVGSHSYHGVHHVFAAVLVAVILMALSLVARMRLAKMEKEGNVVPDKGLTIMNFFELALEVIMGMMESIIGKDYKRYVPMIATCALFILTSNLLGLVPGFVPPTDNLNTTAACAVVILIWFNFHGLRTQGIAHITHLANPVGETWGWLLAPLLFPIEAFGVFVVRPLTLALRLAANMIGDHNVLFAFAGMMPLLIPLPFYFLGFLVCLIQTAVFCILSTVYISLHTAEHEAH